MNSDNREVALFTALIALGLYWFKGPYIYFYLAIILMLLGMFIPSIFNPLTRLLKFIGPKIQKVMSPIMLNLIYFLIVFPVGMFQRITNSTKENYINTNKKVFKKEDFERPF